MRLDFYFDFASGYSYFAARRIEHIAATHGAQVCWHPVVLPALAQSTGTPPAPLVPAKWRYVQHDMARTARQEGIAWRPAPAFPQMLLAPGRGMLWMQARHGEEQARSFARTCFQAYYGDGIDIADTSVLAGIAKSQGADDAAFLDGLAAPDIKQALKRNNELALALGVFGVPFVLAGEEPFWGYDRLDRLAQWLAGRDA